MKVRKKGIALLVKKVPDGKHVERALDRIAALNVPEMPDCIFE